MSKRALVIAIPFADGPGWREFPLNGASQAASEIGAQLERLGFELAAQPTKTKSWSAATIKKRVDKVIDKKDPNGICIVHIAGHGDRRFDSIRPVGADGQTDSDADLDRWLKRIEPDSADGSATKPRTLFIVDTCNSGNAARRAWSSRVDPEKLRGWVLAASDVDEPAYDLRLSRAVAKILTLIADNRLGLAPDVESVPWATFRDRVIEDVERQQGDGLRQRVTSTLLDRTVNPPFFPNPGYRAPDALELAQEQVEEATRPFLDSLATAHVGGRTRGSSPGRRLEVFSGRFDELSELRTWIDDPDERDGLRVVTGSPGAGKSALLSVTTMAAHPRLRPVTVEFLPSTVPDVQEAPVAAVHARGRSASQIRASIGMQLGLTTVGAGWTTEALLAALPATEPRPLIIVDAVDESVEPAYVVDMLRQFGRTRGTADASPVRLLVGTRSGADWAQIDSWIHEQDAAKVIDLDQIAPELLRQDLTRYLSGKLGTDRRAARAAGDIAERLARQHGKKEWGAFLVASLLANSVLANGLPTKDADLDALIAQIPDDLPGVLELDLGHRPDGPISRAVLQCLAWGKGAGIPLRLIQVLTPAFAASPVTDEDVEKVLASLSFYVRTSTDTDGQVLYRLFHQSLIEHLRRAGGRTARRAWKRLLADRPAAAGYRRWDTAEPYLRRHALAHASDAGRPLDVLDDAEYLVHADPGSLLQTLDDRPTWTFDRADESVQERIDTLAALYRQSADRLRDLTSEGRRQILQVEAARFGLADLLGRLREGDPDAEWDVAWATGSGATNSLRWAGGESFVSKVAGGYLPDGAPALVTARVHIRQEVAVWDVSRAVPRKLDCVAGVWVPLFAAGLAPPRLLLLGRTSSIVWNLATDEREGVEFDGFEFVQSAAIARTRLGGLVLAVVADNGKLRFGPLGDPGWAARATLRDGTWTQVVAVPRSDGTDLLLALRRDGALVAWHPVSGAIWHLPFPCLPEATRSLIVVADSDSPILIAATMNDTVWWRWGEDSTRALGRGVRALAGVPAAGKAPAVVVALGDDARLYAWTLPDGAVFGPSIQVDHVTQTIAAVRRPDGRTLVATAGLADSLRIWEVGAESQVGSQRRGHDADIGRIAVVRDEGGPPFVVTGSMEVVVGRVTPLVVHRHDLATGVSRGGAWLLKNFGGIHLAAELADGRAALLVDTAEGVRVWDALSQSLLTMALPSGGRILAATRYRNHTLIALATVRRTVECWRLEGAVPLLSESVDGWPEVGAFALHDGQVRLIVLDHATVRVFDLDGKRKMALELSGPPLFGLVRSAGGVVIIGDSVSSSDPEFLTVLPDADPRRFWLPGRSSVRRYAPSNEGWRIEATWELPSADRVLCADGDGYVAIAFDRDIVVLRERQLSMARPEGPDAE